MRVLITKPYDLVTLRNKRGTPRAMVAYGPSDEPQTVKQAHGEELIAAGVATEVKEPARRTAEAAGKAGADTPE